MGAAEWTGYSSGGTGNASYPAYSSIQTGGGASAYGYDSIVPTDHHANFHLPASKCRVSNEIFL